MELRDLLDRLWTDYVTVNPQAGIIHELLRARGEVVDNDHIALRTFGDPRVDLEVLARPFLAAGYVDGDDYEFPAKGLRARHYDPPTPALPRLFVSALRLGEGSVCSPWAQALCRRLVDAIDPALLARPDLCAAGRPWPAIAAADYERLAAESEYAAWVAAFGYRANHFTVSVNRLRTIGSIAEINALIEAAGIPLNHAGGAIKGGPEVLLEQSSTLAAPALVDLADGARTIPGCYYEFARRYPGPDGRLFGGFVARSADRIFESTDRRAST
ncbi:MAG: DUF1338 domain-containing protein [Nannocystaceae bacterium]